MKIDIITALPNLIQSFFESSILKRSVDKGLVELKIHSLRDYAVNSTKQIDDYQYGGGAGMVLMIEPIDRCISHLKETTNYDEIIYLTPEGEVLNQGILNELSLKNNFIFLCGHYKGIDERVQDLLVTKEISIGDFVLSGGELPAAILADGIIRLIPGVIGDETSALFDSFQDQLLAPPVYTRPAVYKEVKVPEVLLSGNFKKIEAWREKMAEEKTLKRRPDLNAK